MYHFKETDAFSAVVLDDYIELSGHTVRYLKEFQISAVRFLYDHFRKREFCVLNDESGLGKTATAAFLLGTVAMNKNCLIVVANNDERVTDWRFHFNVLTDLNVNVLDEEKDYDDKSAPRVFITKWNTLRAIDDISKMSFDIVVLDNRAQMLNNTFCVSTLLKCFERKVQLVVSSVDITSDVKLMHNILRLGGRLEHQLESFKAFEKKFNLPDIKAISNKKADLEEYFLKREILNDYCRDFRLRRYRHQYEHMLPLVDPERYKAHLAQWIETESLKDKVPESDEMRTEEILQQFVNQANHNHERQLDQEVQIITNDILTNGVVNLQHNHIEATPNDSNDDEVNMSPLVYLSESSDSDAEVVMLSSNSIETVIPIIEIKDDDEKSDNDVQVCAFTEETQKTDIDKLKYQEKKVTEEDKRNSSENVREEIKKVEKAPEEVKEGKAKKPTKDTTERNKKGTNLTRVSQLKREIDKMVTRRTIRNDNVEATKTTPCGVRERRKSTTDIKQATPRKLHNSDIEMVNKKDTITPKKRTSGKKFTEQSVSSNKITMPQRQSKQDKKTSANVKTPNNVVGKEAETKDLNIGTPNERKHRARRANKKGLGCMLGIPKRETRNMQRATRSTSGKRKCFALEFDEEKTRMRATPRKGPTSKQVVSKKEENIENSNSKNKAGSNLSKQQQQITKMNTKEVKKKSEDLGKLNLPSTQDSTVMPPSSSEYEEIQCGQKLVFDSSADNSPHILEKANEFLMPSTPPSMRISNYPLLQQQSGTDSAILFESDSDLTLLSNNHKNTLETVILLSSSQDEASISSHASTEQQSIRNLGRNKRKRFSNRKSIKEPSSFRNALSKDRINALKSPDLFSVGSDIASSNAIPFTQIHSTATIPGTNPAFGFKIFGSEVRRFSGTPPSIETTQPKSRTGRFCLNMLEKTFENKNTSMPMEPKIAIKNSLRKYAQADRNDTETPVSTTLAAPRKPIHESNQHTKHCNDLSSDDIFEITNNTTFGSTMRINASGHISPVPQLNSTQHHNKITNYLIGNGNAKHISSADDEHQLLGTPIKQRLSTTQQPGSSNSTIVPNTKKSPKSTKPTQTTKLTKWFCRSSVDETIKSTRETLKDSKATKTTKRRRLDLSFKS